MDPRGMWSLKKTYSKKPCTATFVLMINSLNVMPQQKSLDNHLHPNTSDY